MAEYQISSGSVSASGDSVVLTPPAGLKPQIFYLALSADGSNSAPVTASLRFTSSAALYTVSLVPGAIFSRNIGAGRFSAHGAPDDQAIVNLSAGQLVNWNLEYWYV